MQRPAEAIAQLLSAVKKAPDDARLSLMLGRAYIRQGEEEKAIGAFEKVLEVSSTSANLNSVARELADSNIRLDDALRYARRSVAMEEDTTTRTISLNAARAADMVEMIRLGQAWDTAGWAHFRLGDFDQARKYFLSAWKLAQNPAAADHMGQLNEKLGNMPNAVRFYALSIAAGRPPDGASARLTALAGGKEQADAAVATAATELEKMRTVTVPRLAKGAAKAQVYLQFAQAGAPDTLPDASTEAAAPAPAAEAGIPASAVHFANGSDELRAASAAIAAARYDIEFPDTRPTMLVRQGNVTCDESSPTCQIVFLSINMINSIN
jgi:tetratricopeptide (TPR) repeat protein